MISKLFRKMNLDLSAKFSEPRGEHSADAINGLLDVAGRLEFYQLANALNNFLLAFMKVAKLIGGFERAHSEVDEFPSCDFVSFVVYQNKVQPQRNTKVHEGVARG